MNLATVEQFIREGRLHLGMTKADVRALLGPPDLWGGTSRRYREPAIWRYDRVELWFERRSGRTPWPGPRLAAVYTESDLGEGRLLVGGSPASPPPDSL